MPNPYTQVALTYVRRFRSLGRTWALIGYVIILLFMTVAFVLRPVDMAFVFLFFMGGTSTTALVNHIKDQFLGDRACLMPNYRRVHFRVAVAIMSIFTVLFPLILTLLAGLHSISLIAGYAVISCIILWGSLRKVLMLLVFPLGFFACFTEPGKIYFKELFTGQHEPQAYAILLFGLATSLWGLFRLFHLTEEDPASQKLQATGVNNVIACKNITAVPWFFKGWSDWLADRHIARLSNHARRASTSGWSRICRWQLGINVALLLRICGMGFWILIIAYISNPDHGQEPLLMLIMFANFIPLFVLGMIQPHQPSREVLLPVDRGSYIRQMGISTVLVFFAAWTVSWSIFLLLVALVFRISMQFEIFVGLLLISAFTYVLIFGVTAWIALCQSKALRIGMMLFPISLQMILMSLALEKEAGILALTMVFVAAVAAVFGLLITYDAYRRWLVTDFD